ncbi:MAG: hypothetical protein LBN08_06165 [Lactobacillales bacterium]|jgi:hypothetical protein|nr:hypothetical protein [Lactobacillales bacterium]
MAQDIILYNEKNDSFIRIAFADGAFTGLEEAGTLDFATTDLEATLKAIVQADTFVLNENLDSKFISMTYNEWEALRTRQANALIASKIASSPATDEEKLALTGLFQVLTDGLNVKYLEGAKSWTAIYTDLFEGLTK